MSALSVHASRGLARRRRRPLRFASAAGRRPTARCSGCCKRNCSIAPRQLLGVYLSLCAVSLAHRGAVLDAGRAAGAAVRRRSSCSPSAPRCWSTPAMPPTARRIALRPGRLHGRAARSAGAPSRSSSRAGLGAGRAGARRRLADRAFGRGPAHRGRPLRAPRAAPRRWPTSCARRCAATTHVATA